jgi:hypothetical protein
MGLQHVISLPDCNGPLPIRVWTADHFYQATILWIMRYVKPIVKQNQSITILAWMYIHARWWMVGLNLICDYRVLPKRSSHHPHFFWNRWRAQKLKLKQMWQPIFNSPLFGSVCSSDFSLASGKHTKKTWTITIFIWLNQRFLNGRGWVCSQADVAPGGS